MGTTFNIWEESLLEEWEEEEDEEDEELEEVDDLDMCSRLIKRVLIRARTAVLGG